MHLRIGLLPLLLAALLTGCTSPTPTTPETPPPVAYEAVGFDTELGAFTVILYADAAPETVALVKALASEGYYEGREFNRVFPGHVIQLVDRAGGATEDPRRVPVEAHPDYHFSAGAAGIARGADPESGGPEFFIMDYATSHLDGNFTVWGQVVEGMDVVRRIARVDAVDARDVPVVSTTFTDRQAVDSVAVTGAEVLTVEVPAAGAAGLPLEVAERKRVNGFVHSMDWPKNLRAGVESPLTWYVRPDDPDAAPPAPEDVVIRVDGRDIPVAGDEVADGAYRWRWTPSAAGAHDASFVADGRTWATLVVNVDP